jgi:hypothetical protein
VNDMLAPWWWDTATVNAKLTHPESSGDRTNKPACDQRD